METHELKKGFLGHHEIVQLQRQQTDRIGHSFRLQELDMHSGRKRRYPQPFTILRTFTASDLGKTPVCDGSGSSGLHRQMLVVRVNYDSKQFFSCNVQTLLYIKSQGKPSHFGKMPH